MTEPALCSVDQCEKKSFCKGYCRIHYDRIRKHGDPNVGRKKRSTCSVENCESLAKSNGMCAMHYARFKRHADPLYVSDGTQPGEAIGWLKAHSNHEDRINCLDWPFAKANGGYGHMRVNGQYVGAHRVMCVIANGEPVTGLDHAAHSCGNSGCVNPHHLRWATRSDNEADKVLHGTSNSGQSHGMSKLTDRDVIKIRSLNGKLRQKQIAEMFGIKQPAVSAILSGKTWKHLLEEKL